MKGHFPEHGGAPPADYFSHHRTEMMDFILHHPRKILDVGCGEAIFSRQLKEEFNAEVWGVELDPQACAAAEKRIDKVFHGDIVQILPNCRIRILTA